MRILVVHNLYRSASPSGENRVVDQEATALEADGHQVERFERRSDDIEQWSALDRVLLPLKVVRNGETRRDLTATIHRYRPDVVHVHNTFPVLSPSVLQACHEARVPTVATIHNFRLLCASTTSLFREGKACHDCLDRLLPLPALAHRCYRGSYAATLPLAAGIVVNRRTWRTLVSAFVFVSESQRRLFTSLQLPPARTFVKANLVPPIPTPTVVGKRRNMVAYVGRLDDAKGIPLLMKAWEQFRPEPTGDGLRLVIAGDGPLADVVRAWAGGRTDVDAVGLLSASDCGALLSTARAALIPSQCEETFGLVAVEAMSAGVAPVAAEVGAFPQLISDGTDGVLFNSGDPGALADVLHDIDLHPERFVHYGEHARHTYLERFEPAKNLRQLLTIYQFAMKSPVWAGRTDQPRPSSSTTADATSQAVERPTA
jgi:glycosyltransferase involved in cell wall biosynthesis